MLDFKVYPIEPCAKPRMTQRDKWKNRPCVERYRQFKDECREHGVSFGNSLRVVFVIPMPRSWSKKRRESMNGTRHQAKPDIDNLCKALLDACLEDDAHVWELRASKFWGETGSIQVYRA